jgi:Domain of unknown function (DUF4411)
LVYLIDSDALIRADRQYYPPNRFPIFWTWLLHMGISGNAKMPREQYEEIVSGRGALVDWLRSEEVKQALLLAEDADPTLVAEVVLRGYGQLDEVGLERVGRDPFLIAYAFADRAQRTVVTLEVSAPRRQGANRKIPAGKDRRFD